MKSNKSYWQSVYLSIIYRVRAFVGFNEKPLKSGETAVLKMFWRHVLQCLPIMMTVDRCRSYYFCKSAAPLNIHHSMVASLHFSRYANRVPGAFSTSIDREVVVELWKAKENQRQVQVNEVPCLAVGMQLIIQATAAALVGRLNRALLSVVIIPWPWRSKKAIRSNHFYDGKRRTFCWLSCPSRREIVWELLLVIALHGII